uniref:Uncharacterized protein n=1 Tax=Anguilla anguilla TaxID=7936 RepID=A0A0E9WH93_ANGAN
MLLNVQLSLIWESWIVVESQVCNFTDTMLKERGKSLVLGQMEPLFLYHLTIN